jgi:Ca2+-binding EF-hand superfamily protein
MSASSVDKIREDGGDSESDDESKSNRKKSKPISVRIKSLALSLTTATVDLFKKNPTKILLERFRDHEGLLDFALGAMQSTSSERTYWVNMWLQIDADMNNKMSYMEFCDFFSIEPDEYASRLFLMMNTSLTGVVNLAEFLSFCYQYLTIDKRMTEEFAFRMLSRRAAAEINEYTNINLEDIRWFVNTRYRSKSVKKRNKFAYEIFCYMDQDGDGGLSIDEWHEVSIIILKNSIYN